MKVRLTGADVTPYLQTRKIENMMAYVSSISKGKRAFIVIALPVEEIGLDRLVKTLKGIK